MVMNVIDLYCGGGGLSEPFQDTKKYNIVAQVDKCDVYLKGMRLRNAFHYLKSKNRLDIYEKYVLGRINEPRFWKSVPFSLFYKAVEFDIQPDNTDKLIHMLEMRLDGAKLDILLASPAFSKLNDLGSNKDDNVNKGMTTLLPIVRVLNKFKPAYSICEFSTEVMRYKSKHYSILEMFVRVAGACGYKCETKKLDYFEYGISQKTQRVVVFCMRDDIHSRVSFFDCLRKLKQHPLTPKELLADLPALNGHNEEFDYVCEPQNKLIKDYYRANNTLLTAQVARETNDKGKKILQMFAKASEPKPDNVMWVTKEGKHTAELAKLRGQGYGIINGDYLAPSVKFSYYEASFVFHWDTKQQRAFSVREIYRIQGVPDDYTTLVVPHEERRVAIVLSPMYVTNKFEKALRCVMKHTCELPDITTIDDAFLRLCKMAEIAAGTLDDNVFFDAITVLKQLKDENVMYETALARYFYEIARDKIVECGKDVDKARKIRQHMNVILKYNAPDDLDMYMLYMENKRKPEQRFWLPRRHVLAPVAQGFQALADDLIDLLVICLPPRVGKSTLGIFALTWHMGKTPSQAHLMSGHSSVLTDGFYKEALNIINDKDTYCYSDVFSDAKLVSKSAEYKTIDLKRRSRFPSLTCRSIDGTLTGAVEVSKQGWLYCDDLVSDREEALSVNRMDKLYDAYANQLKDRMLDGAKEIHVGTRWVPNDVIGHVLETRGDSPRSRVIIIPALNDEEQTNFDYLYDLGFSSEYYLEMRETLRDTGAEDSWCAKYLGKPYFIGGLMFPEEQLKFFDNLPDGEPDAVLAVCDTKNRGKDYAVQPIVKVYNGKHYVVDVICDNSLPEIVEPRLTDSLVRNGVQMALYESNNAGGRIALAIAEECKNRGLTIEIKTKYSTENKETRILVDSGWIKENCYFKRNGLTPDYKKFLKMLTSYSTEGRNAHDDAPDAMSMYKRFVSANIEAQVEPMQRPF